MNAIVYEFIAVVLIMWLLIIYASWGGLVLFGVLIFNAWTDLNIKGWVVSVSAAIIWGLLFVYGFPFVHDLWVAL